MHQEVIAMTPGPIDLQVIMNKTPVTEKVQEVMERNAEQRQAFVAQEMERQNEQNARSVTNVPRSENPVIDERNRKKREQEKKKKKKAPPESTTGHNIDIEA
jgi:D-ribose pyranose/furanose isomerase RbsD